VAADDVLWRRTKCGLHMTEAQRAALADYVATRASALSPAPVPLDLSLYLV
jgi:glycerol-3-phosphate dehydrogenase